MSRPFLVVALLFIASEGMCNQACQTCEFSELAGVGVVQPFQQGFEVYARPDCTTCAHSTIVVSGTFPPGTGPNDFLAVQLRFSCYNSQGGKIDELWQGLTRGGEVEFSGPTLPFRKEWTEVNVKSPCQENPDLSGTENSVQVKYYVRAYNDSDKTVSINVSINCPVFKNGIAPAPSRHALAPARNPLQVAWARLSRPRQHVDVVAQR